MALSKIFVLGLIFGFVQLFSVEARVLGHLAPRTLGGLLDITATPVTLPVTLPVTTPDLLENAGKLLTDAGNLLSSTPNIPLTTPDLGLTTPAGDPMMNNDPLMDLLAKCADMVKNIADMMQAIIDNMTNPNGGDSTTPGSTLDPLGNIVDGLGVSTPGITLPSLPNLLDGITLPSLPNLLDGITLPSLPNLLDGSTLPTLGLDDTLGSTTPDPSGLLDDIKQPKGMGNKDPKKMNKHHPGDMAKNPEDMTKNKPKGMKNKGQPDYSRAKSQAFAESGGGKSNSFASSQAGRRRANPGWPNNDNGDMIDNANPGWPNNGMKVVKRRKVHHRSD